MRQDEIELLLCDTASAGPDRRPPGPAEAAAQARPAAPPPPLDMPFILKDWECERFVGMGTLRLIGRNARMTVTKRTRQYEDLSAYTAQLAREEERLADLGRKCEDDELSMDVYMDLLRKQIDEDGKRASELPDGTVKAFMTERTTATS